MNVVIGFLGPVLDFGRRAKRWEKWRPTVSIFQHDDFSAKRMELLYQDEFLDLAKLIKSDIEQISPETEVILHQIDIENPWDFEEVYSGLHDFASSYKFDTNKNDYYVHITTGTHVAQICMYLLTESRYLPAKLLQTSPPNRNAKTSSTYTTIDLDLSKYDLIAQRFHREQQQGLSFLKEGIDTKNKLFNNLIEQIENVAIKSKSPILLYGATGVGKTRLARKIFELKKNRQQINDPFVEVNCATIRGDNAMSTLFGHTKGAFTGATSDRNGLLKNADGGMLFLDEIGELGLDEQAMLLHAIEEKTFRPLGSDKDIKSDFQLIAGTNRNLLEEVSKGNFREDLLARINLWQFELPGLSERREDIEPNIEFELQRFAQKHGSLTSFNTNARKKYLAFAKSEESIWSSNFRDLNASITRMATLAPGGRIDLKTVNTEIERLNKIWHHKKENRTHHLEDNHIIPKDLDPFDQIQLSYAVNICKSSNSMAEAGRKLYAFSRKAKSTPNDSDRLRKYLQKFGISWVDIKNSV